MAGSYARKGLGWIVLVGGLFALAAWLHGGIDYRSALLLLGLCFVCELVDSGLGMGYGTILTPTLLLLGYDAHDIVPTVLLSELLSGMSAAFFHNEIRNVELGRDGRDLIPAVILAAGSVVGVTAGVFLAVNLPRDVLNVGVGCIILLSGVLVVSLSHKFIEYRHWKMVLLAGVASFNKAVSGGGYGPLVTSGQILSGVPTRASVGITSFAEAFTCLIGVTLFLALGGWINLGLFIPLCAGALLSVPFSVFAVSKARERLLSVAIGLLTIAMGFLTIYKGWK
jgi:uncharacterized membrane protein YfcA